MKKSIAIISSTIILLGLSACSPQKNENLNNQEQNNQEITENPSEKNDGTWGAFTYEKTVENENGINSFLINLPESYPADAGSARVSENSDGTMILLDSENGETSPKVNSIEEVFPAYTEQTMTNLGYWISSRYKELDLTFKNKELVEVNGYTFCKYEGIHTYTYKKEPGSRQFVAYVVELKKSDAYAFWIVFDISIEQSNKKLIEEHAYNMALTLQEK